MKMKRILQLNHSKLIPLFLVLLALVFGDSASAQQDVSIEDFKNYQLGAPRVAQAYKTYEGKLKSMFHAKKFSWPPDDILFRSFKAQNEMEVWVKDKGVDTYRLFQKYPVCALSGSLGPKRWEGDRQVPEGFYFISNFNPRSEFHLSLLINYPNYSDLLLGNKQTPGGDIYIHGGCLTVGCLPMTDEGIKEIYTLAFIAKISGQANIPIHIFPVRFNERSIDFLAREYVASPEKHRFWINLKAGYDYFEKYKKILPVMYNSEGKYVF